MNSKLKELDVVVFNAPPYAGKDYAADYLVRAYDDVIKVQFKDKLIELVKVIYSLTDDEFDTMYQRDNKEQPQDKLGGLSIREAMIYVSEEVIKPKFGKAYFGTHTAKKILSKINHDRPYAMVVIPDGGFKEEIRRLHTDLQCQLRLMGRVSISVKVLRLQRDGTSFAGDSRNYLQPEDVPFAEIVDIYNNGDSTFLRKIDNVLLY